MRFLRLFLLLCSFSVLADSHFTRIGVDDGLPNTTIYSAVQDKEGFIWFGANNSGLLRYDGYQFTEFPVLTAEEQKQETMSLPDVGVMIIDRQQNLWIGTWGLGVSKMDAVSGELHRYNTHDSLAGDQIQALMEDQAGHIWVGSTGGLNRISATGDVSRIGAPDSETTLINQRIWSLAETADGTVWIGTAAGLHSWTAEKGLSQPLQLFPQSAGLSRDNEIRALFVHNHELWVGTRSGIYVAAVGSQSFKLVSLNADDGVEPLINVITVDHEQQLLVGTFSGVFRLDAANRRYHLSASNKGMLSDVNVRAILVDRSSVLWVGTRDSSLFRSTLSARAFSDLSSLLGNVPEKLQHFSVTAVFEHDDILWVGGTEELYRINLLTHVIEVFDTAGRVNAINATPDGHIYIATDEGLLRYQHGSALETITEPFEEAGISNRNIRDLLIDQQGELFIGLWGEGVVAWQPQTHHVRHWLSGLAALHVGNAVQAMYLDADGLLWIGTRYSGIYQLNPADSTIRQHNILQGEGGNPHNNEVNCITQAGNKMAFCTKRGLFLYDTAHDTQQLFDKENGLIDEKIHGFYQSASQIKWLMSAKGLIVQFPDNPRFINYTSQDGLITTELNNKAIFAGKHALYLGSMNGLIVVKPELLSSNESVPQPVLSRVEIDHRLKIEKPHASDWPVITLSPENYAINLEFSALDFQDTLRNAFQYRLEGIDQHWVTIKRRNNAFYANLPAGEYTLLLKAANNHGLYGEARSVVTLVVLPEWWQRWWVMALLTTLLLFMFWFMHRYRLRHERQINRLLQAAVDSRAREQEVLEIRVKERTSELEQSSDTLSVRTRQLEKSLAELAQTNRELERLDKLKDEFVATVSHELRTPLTAIRGAIGLIAQKVIPADSPSYDTMLQTALANSERLSHLINDLLDLQKFAAGKFALAITTQDLAALSEQAFSGMQPYAERFGVKLLYDNQAGSPLLVKADAMRLRQVMDNLVSNAVKFSEKGGTVTLRLEQQSDSVKFVVIDQGTGIPAAFQSRLFEKFSQADASDSKVKEGTGLGLAICKKIIESHQGNIGFHSEEGKGSTFWFSLKSS